MSSQHFCLKWNNHLNNMMDVFKNLLSTESMVDCTLACDGLSLKAHKMVLSACSPFFQSLFLENPCKHPIVILKDMKYTELKAIIEFMYHGEVNVAQDQLSALMKTAETLRVKGLAEVTNDKNSSAQDEPTHRSVPRAESPPLSRKPNRRRVRKRSLSDSNRSDESNEPKIKQPPSPDIEELSGDVTMDNSSQFSNIQSHVPMQSTPSHSTNSYHRSSSIVTQDPQIEEPASADESEFGVEPAKLLEQTLTTDDLNARRSRSALQSMEMQRRPRSSTDHSNILPSSMPSEALSSNTQPDSPPDIKPELLDLDPPMSPVAGPSHSGDNSMMMYMDQSSVSSHPGTSFQDSTALVPQDAQPQGFLDNSATELGKLMNPIVLLKKLNPSKMKQGKKSSNKNSPSKKSKICHEKETKFSVSPKVEEIYNLELVDSYPSNISVCQDDAGSSINARNSDAHRKSTDEGVVSSHTLSRQSIKRSCVVCKVTIKTYVKTRWMCDQCGVFICGPESKRKCCMKSHDKLVVKESFMLNKSQTKPKIEMSKDQNRPSSSSPQDLAGSTSNGTVSGVTSGNDDMRDHKFSFLSYTRGCAECYKSVGYVKTKWMCETCGVYGCGPRSVRQCLLKTHNQNTEGIKGYRYSTELTPRKSQKKSLLHKVVKAKEKSLLHKKVKLEQKSLLHKKVKPKQKLFTQKGVKPTEEKKRPDVGSILKTMATISL